MGNPRFDLIVIGSGPGGEGAAMNAAKNGLKVLVVENRPQVGGSATHTATIPSKALRSAVRELMNLTTKPLFQELVKPGRLTVQQLLRSAESIIRDQVTVRRGFY